MSRSRVVVLGGGFGGLFTALELAGHTDVTLITEADHFLFTPMLYEYLSGEVEAWHIAPKYSELVDDDINVITDTVSKIDLDTQSVTLEANSTLSYDELVLAVGGVTNYVGVPGAEEFSIPFRKIEHADRIRSRMVAALDRVPPETAPQDVRRNLTFAVVGAGASGCELSTKMTDLLADAVKRRALRGEPRVLVIEMGDKVVPGMGDEIREFVVDALRQSRVEVHTSTRVVNVTSDGLTFEHDGQQEHLPAAGVVWTGGVKMRPLIEHLDVEKNRRGLLSIKPTLQLVAHDNVFALGDIANFVDATPTLAGTAQLAYQQASLAAKNIRAFASGKPLQTQKFEELGEALSLGTERAAVLAGGKAFGGAL
ncbi:MAG TPA: NAD(P)/FAD-dependent oxidoreductase, partial [Pyrinomonadaceae bacterium]